MNESRNGEENMVSRPDGIDNASTAYLVDALRISGIDPDMLKARYVEERERRINSSGNKQYVPTEGAFENFGADPWAPARGDRAPIEDHTEVIIAGGGFGGLLAGARLRENGCDDIRIIEEAGDFGGTWYWNRYPGAMCDIDSHIYLPLIEELDYTPKHRYSYAPELFELAQMAGRQYDLYRKACFQTSIIDVRWQDDERRWLVTTDRGDRLTCDILMLACGRQSLPKLPGIPGIETFKGHAFHSSRWDYAYTGGSFWGGMTGLADKRVAVIGTGATAIQIVPEVAKDAHELLVFQRTPSSVAVRGNRETPPGYVDRSKPGWQRERRYNFQRIISGLPHERDEIDDGWTELTRLITPPKPAEVAAALGHQPDDDELNLLAELYDYKVMEKLRSRIGAIVDDPETAELLKPWYRWFCKRPCFHDDYLETFNRPNVRLIDTAGRGVERITPNGIMVAGVEHPVDCLIFATGFEAGISYTRLTGFEIYGRDCLPLSEHWKDGVRTLHGMMTDKFPNCFFMGGNQQTATAINAVHLLDEQALHFGYLYRTMKERMIHRVEVKPEAADRYVDIIRSSPANKALVEFYKDCTPGFYNGEGTAKKSEEIFFGGRYGDGPIPFFQMLEAWREGGNLDGLELDDGETETSSGQGAVPNIIS